jgi:hypothetical protein
MPGDRTLQNHHSNPTVTNVQALGTVVKMWKESLCSADLLQGLGSYTPTLALTVTLACITFEMNCTYLNSRN